MKLMLITDLPEVARCAIDYGVDRIFVDLELIGKVQRQGHLNTVISRHSIDDVAAVRRAIPDGELLVRLNPLYSGSRSEIDRVLDAGADLLMLPMFDSSDEVAEFSRLVAGRVGVIPLVETAGAAADISRLTQVPGLTEVFVGLNDLHLSLGRTFMFELVADGTVENLATVVRDAALPFGFGGIARIGEGLLPAELILGEHLRLHSSSVILSRTFFQDPSRQTAEERFGRDFGDAITALRNAESQLIRRSQIEVETDRRRLMEITQQIVADKRRRAA